MFQEFKSNSSVMVVIEGDKPLGDDSHKYYDEIVDKLEADKLHIEHVQDFWGDPLTASGAQSSDGLSAYVQVYTAGNQGEALANESVEAAENIVQSVKAPEGVKVYFQSDEAVATVVAPQEEEIAAPVAAEGAATAEGAAAAAAPAEGAAAAAAPAAGKDAKAAPAGKEGKK